jgi:hypothetical protein
MIPAIKYTDTHSRIELFTAMDGDVQVLVRFWERQGWEIAWVSKDSTVRLVKLDGLGYDNYKTIRR